MNETEGVLKIRLPRVLNFHLPKTRGGVAA
jgi:hypothetical protein